MRRLTCHESGTVKKTTECGPAVAILPHPSCRHHHQTLSLRRLTLRIWVSTTLDLCTTMLSFVARPVHSPRYHSNPQKVLQHLPATTPLCLHLLQTELFPRVVSLFRAPSAREARRSHQNQQQRHLTHLQARLTRATTMLHITSRPQKILHRFLTQPALLLNRLQPILRHPTLRDLTSTIQPLVQCSLQGSSVWLQQQQLLLCFPAALL